jgi:hypothetical protein
MPDLVALMAVAEPSIDLTPVDVWFPECSPTPPVALPETVALPPAQLAPELSAGTHVRSDLIWLGGFGPAPPFEEHPLTEAYRSFAASHPRAGGPLSWKSQLAQMLAEENAPPAPTPNPLNFAALRQHLIDALGLELPLAELAARPVSYDIGPWHLETRNVDGSLRRFEWAEIVWQHDLLGVMDGVIARPVDPVDSPAPAFIMEHGHEFPDLRFLPCRS